MRELTNAEIAAVNGAGRRPINCYPPRPNAGGFALVGALAVGGAVALGVAAVVKLKLLALALC